MHKNNGATSGTNGLQDAVAEYASSATAAVPWIARPPSAVGGVVPLGGDAQLVSDVYVALPIGGASCDAGQVSGFRVRVVGLPGAPAVGTGDSACAVALPLGSSPHVEALAMNVLATGGLAPDQGLVAGP